MVGFAVSRTSRKFYNSSITATTRELPVYEETKLHIVDKARKAYRYRTRNRLNFELSWYYFYLQIYFVILS